MVDVQWALIAVALAVGFLVGITGVGGGALMTPILVAFFGVPITIAVATDLLFATITKVIGVWPHHRVGNIDWKLASRLWSGSIPGVIVGVILVVFFASQELTQWLVWPLALLVLLTAITLGKRAIKVPETKEMPASPLPDGIPKPVLATSGGFGIGLAVALTSVGAGALGMALLVKLSARNTKPQHLVGTDLIHAIPIALIAGVAYGFSGLISWPLLFTLLIGSIPGVILGSLLSHKAPVRIMNGLLATVLFAAVLLIIFK